MPLFEREIEKLDLKPGERGNALALLSIAQSIDNVARALFELGLDDADTPMGAIEALSVSIKDGFESLANATRRNIDD